jgi:hypothetical protein
MCVWVQLLLAFALCIVVFSTQCEQYNICVFVVRLVCIDRDNNYYIVIFGYY